MSSADTKAESSDVKDLECKMRQLATTSSKLLRLGEPQLFLQRTQLLQEPKYAWLQERHPLRFNERLQKNIDGTYAYRCQLPKNQLDYKCERCWMRLDCCFCSQAIKPLALNCDVVGYLHWREASVRKASNTAKLVPLVLETGRLIGCGDIENEAWLYNKLENDPKAVILYPGHGCMEISDLIKKHEEESKKSGVKDDKPWTLVLLDGTWGEAKTLNRLLPPTTQRVTLGKEPEAILRRLGTRTAHANADNIQSFAAVISALSELGVVEEHIKSLTEQLELAVGAYLKQTFPEKGQKGQKTT
eukprot:m.239484 g.239484  ORF g.239484 m.239484 type:complete len:302 (-) comp16068_c0_seq8:3543-4448(-)